MHRLAILLVCVLTAATALAAPAPPSQPAPPITAANAKDLRPLRNLPHDVWRAMWGPKRGELSLLAWDTPGKVLSATTYKMLREVGPGKKLVHLAFDSGGDQIAWCENNTKVEAHDLKARRTVVLETGNSQPGMAFSPDGKLLATGGYGTVAKLWAPTTGALVRSFDVGPLLGALTAAFSPDGKQIAIGNRNHTTRLYEVATGKLLHELPRKMSHELKFSPDGKTLAVAYVNGEVGLWDTSSGNLLRSRATGAREVYTLDWGKKGDILATAGLNGKIILWRSADLTVLKELEAPEWVIRVSFSPDGARLLSGGGSQALNSERKVTVWGLGGK